MGYGSGDLAWPVITGRDAEAPSVKAIIAGEKYSTVYKDTRELAKVTADLVDTVLSGGSPEGLDNHHLRQWRQGRSLDPADPVLGRPDQLSGTGRRLGLYQAGRPSVSF